MEMTKDQINQKMAEIMGWTLQKDEPDWGSPVTNKHGTLSGIRTHHVPYYASDLNLVREVELKLKEQDFEVFVDYIDRLQKDNPDLFPELADAETRCLAIIKTWDSTQMEKEKG